MPNYHSAVIVAVKDSVRASIEGRVFYVVVIESSRIPAAYSVSIGRPQDLSGIILDSHEEVVPVAVEGDAREDHASR